MHPLLPAPTLLVIGPLGTIEMLIILIILGMIIGAIVLLVSWSNKKS